MKRCDLERHLAEHGCQRIREGANHAIWVNPPQDFRAPVPRQIMRRLLRDIAEGRDLGDVTSVRDPTVIGPARRARQARQGDDE